jgi:hypothetical protein
MQTESTRSLADRFTRFVERLCAVIGVYAAVFPWARPLVAAAQDRVRRLGDRFARLAARATAGTLPLRRQSAARGPDTAPSRPPTLPWLMQAVAAAVHCAEPFNRLLADPEMAQLVAAAPQAGRILRPLCRMLGVKRPAYLRPPRRAPAQPEVSPAAPLAEPQSGPTQSCLTQPQPPPAPPPQPPPAHLRSKAEDDAIRYAARPGGLYWNGTGFRWS